jgi:SET domain-containing protein
VDEGMKNSKRRPKRPVLTFEVKPSPIEGRGLFTTSGVRGRRKLGYMAGELISVGEARRRARTRKRIAIVELDHRKAVDGSTNGNEFRFTNHSCTPNAFIRTYREQVEIWSLHNIRVGEEITCNYGYSQHEGTLRCRCGSNRCRGSL